MYHRLAVSKDNAHDPQKERRGPQMASAVSFQPEILKNNLDKGDTSFLGMAMNSFPRQQKLKQFVFTDPVAFRFLEEDLATVVIERHGIIEGYQLYLVEQWAYSRTHPTFVINTYTGDSNDRVIVGVLGVPSDEELWSPRLRLYFNAISEYYARLQETPLGLLMVTNLNCFPSTFTIIPVPDGDVNRHRHIFLVNENLKRLGCSGRSGISLTPPTAATQAKFFQLYKTSQRVPLNEAVIELVKLCQVALVLFGKLEQEYADGCLCDITEIAITEWWTEIGSEHYNTEPPDGILGPTTVAGLLGMLLGARNRLSFCGAPVGKDAFDLYHLKRGTDHFQKSQKLKRTRRLDRLTIDRLHKVTAKAAAGEGWAVPKTVKSTVAELSGKGGEMVLGIVGRERAGIGDIETLNIDNFINLANGERAKWLWHGKPRRNGMSEAHIFPPSRDDSANFVWSHGKSEIVPTEDDPETRWKEEKSPVVIYPRHLPAIVNSVPDSPSERDHLHRTVFKSVSGKMNDARNGFGRIKGAVGLRGYAHRQSKDEVIAPGSSLLSGVSPASAFPPSPNLNSRIFTWRETPSRYQIGAPKVKDDASRPVSQLVDVNSETLQGENSVSAQNDILRKQELFEKDSSWVTDCKNKCATPSLNEVSFAGSVDEVELDPPNVETGRLSKCCKFYLQRRNSISGGTDTVKRFRNENWWPRHMSFSEAEDALFYWKPVSTQSDEEDGYDHLLSSNDDYLAGHLKCLLETILSLQNDIKPWVESKLSGVIQIDEQLLQDQENFQVIYGQLMDQYRTIKHRSQEVLGLEHAQVLEEIKEIEVLRAKLEYEIHSLESKVYDVEDGVIQLERQVDELEQRADGLEMQLNSESWTRWIVRSLTGTRTESSIYIPNDM